MTTDRYPQEDFFFIERYRRRVEERLEWGDGRNWRDQDFASLSEKIYAATGVLLSVTTLKRIWGKLPYDSSPNAKTLNALAAFLGHENWQAFRAAEAGPQPGIKDAEAPTAVQRPRSKLLRQLWPATLLMLLAVLAGLLFIRSEAALPSGEALSGVQFSSRPVAEGVPNTVVFRYDVSGLGLSDIQIQQNWDSTRRVAVDPKGHEATSIYYYPGYWRAKLLAGGRVIREHDLYIRSGGWLATLGRGERPRYFLPQEWAGSPGLAIRDSILKSIYTRQPPDVLTFHYIENFGDLDGDRFSFSARLRNTYEGGDGVCRESQVVIQCTEGAFVIPLFAPGCSGDQVLYISGERIEGGRHDLSALGCDFPRWQELRGEVRDRRLRLFLNEKLVLEHAYERPIGRVAGVRLRFFGAGEAEKVVLKDEDGRVVFSQ